MPEQNPASARPRHRWRRRVMAWLVTVVAAVTIAFVIRSSALEAFSIPSASMEPTLELGDRILVLKAFFDWHSVTEGEVVVFKTPRAFNCGGAPPADLVKRVIALPGQRIFSIGNVIYVDGHVLHEPYLPHGDQLGRPIPDASRQHPYVVPTGDFYVMGDNRDISCDSRYWGPIKGSSIVGQAVLLWWHNGHPDFRSL